MKNKNFLVDFTGTLIKAEIVEQANELRSKILQRSLPTKEEHGKPQELYKINREFVEKLTGLKKNINVAYRENDLDFIVLTGEQVQNQISTNLFQIGMYMIAKRYGKNIVQKGFVEQLRRIKKLGYKLAIASGVRQDIISGMLQIAKVPVEFDYIYGQPPILGVTNEGNIKSVKAHGKIEYIIGDKLSDFEFAKDIDAKSIFVKWGHPSGGEEAFADYTIKNAKELTKIIK